MIILIFALSILVVGGVKLAVAAKMEYSALLGIPRSLVYAMAPISGVFIIISQIVNLYEDFTGKQLTQTTPQAAEAIESTQDNQAANVEQNIHSYKSTQDNQIDKSAQDNQSDKTAQNNLSATTQDSEHKEN